jgi:hypothetical protein
VTAQDFAKLSSAKTSTPLAVDLFDKTEFPGELPDVW